MSLTNSPTADQIKRVPKALLHDHLDGGLRPETIIEIAQKIGYKKLPTEDPKKLAEWFEESCNSHSLVRYLETFSHTIAVMQTKEAIIQIARECAIDLARDGVVYAEVRGAPELFTEQGLTLDQVVEATTEGYKQGMAEAAREGKNIRVESLLCGMRLGHGVRIIDDIDFSGSTPKLGPLASYVRDRRIPLELCPTSNLQTGAAKTYAEHPIGILAKLRFRVTLNTDNRLMSNTTMTNEMTKCVKSFDWKFADLQRVTVNALKSSFIPFEERLEIIEKTVKPAYAAISAE